VKAQGNSQEVFGMFRAASGPPGGREWAQNVAPGASFRTPKYRPKLIFATNRAASGRIWTILWGSKAGPRDHILGPFPAPGGTPKIKNTKNNNKKWNDLLTNYFCMYPIFSSIEGYRVNHLRHHQNLNTEDDPDWFAKLGRKDFTFPKSKREFVLTLLSYFLLIKGLSDALWIFGRIKKQHKPKNTSFKTKLPVILFYALLITILTLTGGWYYYLIYWVVPYFSTFFMFQYIRSVAEHFGELEYDHLLTSTRSVRAHFVERFFFAPHQVSFHLEHHLYPGVPYYNLPKLHALLMEDSFYREKAHITHGYVKGLFNELGHYERSQTRGLEVSA
ncbi:MAG: fatty acid desaturase family protein, partial [Bacteroidota bacterium]